MELSAAVERLELLVNTDGTPDATLSELKAALSAAVEVESFIAARKASVVCALNEHPSAFAEAAIADTSGCSLGAASKERERAETLEAATAMADALSDGEIRPGHVDALTRAARNLHDEATAALLGDDTLAAAAANSTISDFDALLKRKAKQLDRSDPEERLDKQRRAARVRSWTDDDGMFNLKGRFDPEVGKDIARQLAARVATIRSGELPTDMPADGLERAQHIDALALADLILGDAPVSAGGAPIVVVDASQSDGAGGPVVDWGIPVELPASVLFDIFATNDPDVVIVANGVVLHAPGRLNLGRTTRLANRAQRRALRGLYSMCAVPGCSVHYDRCRLHHIVFWRNGGRTDLDNLLPVCHHHHSRIHDDGWELTLGPNRNLTITLPDGQTLRTDPPKHSAA